MKSCNMVLTFESVGKILWCYYCSSFAWYYLLLRILENVAILLKILASFGSEDLRKVRTGAKDIFNLPDENVVEP